MKIKNIIVLLIIVLAFSLAACDDLPETTPSVRQKIGDGINNFFEQTEKKFILEDSYSISTVVRKVDIYMYIKTVYKNPTTYLGETTERIFQNGKLYNLIDKTYTIDDNSPHFWFSNSFLGTIIPSVYFFDFERTTFEEINKDKYKMTVCPNDILPFMVQIIINESEFSLK